jgi:hypothetical protein
MKNIAIVIILYFIGHFECISQDIYFISGHPFRNISTQFPSVVYKYEGDTLTHKLQISNENLLLLFVKVYPEQHVVTALTSEYKTKLNQETLCIIHTNKPDSVYRIKIEPLKDMYCSHSNLIGLSSSEIFECYECFDKDNVHKSMKERGVREYGWNVYDFSKKELTPDDYKNVIITGSPASAIEGWDFLQLYSNSKNGQLLLPVTPDTSKRPIFPYILPDSLQIKEKRLLAIAVNNSLYTVVLKGHINSSPKEMGASELYIYNKSKSIWYKFTIKGSNESMRGFGTWLAGSVVSNNEQIIFDEQGRVKDKIEFNRISPGKENRRQKGTSTGTPFDFRTDFNKLYYPGILYLLNVPTCKYIEWNTGQGDSEILLVENEIVYYRINDEIYKARILNSMKLGQAELLIKDPRIPDIHWAFISNH